MSNILGACIAVRSAFDPASCASGAQTPIVIDAQDPDNALWDDGVVTVKSGAISGAPDATSIDIAIQHCDDNATWVQATDDRGNNYAQAGIIDGANQIAKLRFDRQILKRYIQAVITVHFTNGTSPHVLVSADFIFGNAHQLPTS